MLTVLQITTNKFGKSADSKDRFVLKYFPHAQCLFTICCELSGKIVFCFKVLFVFHLFVITIFAFANKSSDHP